jgi:hypothetical protein
MGSTNQYFVAIKMSEAVISDIRRSPGKVGFSVSNACVRADHPSNPTGKHLIVHNCRLELEGVSREEALSYDPEEVEWIPHPNPECPLGDDVFMAEFRKDHFFFNGYQGELEVEWRIYATHFVFSWEHEEFLAVT